MKISKKVLVICLTEALLLSPSLELSAQEGLDLANIGKSTSPEDSLRFKELKAKINELRKQAKEQAKQDWTWERWEEESSNSRGVSSSTTGGILGFTLGATAGMLAGKGIQGQKVEREVYHPPGEWGNPPAWTEVFYSYRCRRAPYYGAAVGGIAGGLIGYSLGRKADKQYYLLVPKQIRTAHASHSGFGCFLLGFGVIGVVTGEIAGRTLYAPQSGDIEKTKFGWAEFWSGYAMGSILGTIAINGLSQRAAHLQLWEKSVEFGNLQAPLGIRLLPLDLTAIRILPYQSENGSMQCEYGLNIIRISL